MSAHANNHLGALRKKLLAAMILAPAIPFILVLGVGYYYFTNSLKSEIGSRMERVAQDHRGSVDMFLTDRRGDLRLMADTVSYQEMKNQTRLAKVFENLRAKSPAFVDLGVFDQDGLHLAYVGPYQLAGRNYSEATWFQEVMAQGWYISDIFLGIRKVPHFIIAISVQDKGHSWVLRATIDTLFFTELVERVRMGRTGEAYLVNREGILQTEPRSGGALLQKAPQVVGMEGGAGDPVVVREAPGVGGEPYIYATTWLKEKKWLLLVRQEKSDALGDLHQATYWVSLILLVGAAGILVSAFSLTGYLVGRIKTADEEKSQLTNQLFLAGRLAELGEMSAGFAHEINNPLQIIRAEQALMEAILDEMKQDGLLDQVADAGDLLDSLKQIKIQVDRCGGITQGILKFARRKEPASASLAPAPFMAEVLALVDKKAQVNGVALRSSSQDHLPNIKADPGQLQQVILNLVNNALDAVNDRHGAAGGEVTVELAARDGQVLLSVGDNGSGISSENLERIFTPFFTTKPVGKGTGLGLSVCFGIVDKMGGSIEVDSKPGQGSRFTVVLPAV